MNPNSSPPDLTPTGEKRLSAWAHSLNWDALRKPASKDEIVIPGIDTAALSRHYGMANAVKPQIHEAVFNVPVNATAGQYERLKMAALEKWFVVMQKKGWDLYATSTFRIEIGKGVYPAYDLMDGLARFDQREYIARAWFRFRNPQPRRIELDPLLVNPYVLRKGA